MSWSEATLLLFYSLTLILVLIVTLWAVCTRRGLAQPSTRERPLMTSDIRVGRGSKIAAKIGRYRVGQGR